MSLRRLFPILSITTAVLAAPAAAQTDVARYRAAADSLIRAATADSAAWERIHTRDLKR